MHHLSLDSDLQCYNSDTDPTVGSENQLGGRDRYWVETASVSDVRRLRSSISHSRSAEDARETHTLTCKGKGKARSNSC